MGLCSIIERITGEKVQPREPRAKWPKLHKQRRYFEDKDGNTVILDRNGQICGGTFFSTHNGRPCLLKGNKLLCPVTTMVEDAVGDGWHPEFCEYEVLLVLRKEFKK